MAAYFGETVLVDTDLDTEHKGGRHAAGVEKAHDDVEHSEQVA
jgi:hypothetical protein